jgi:hypothetical protein
MLNPRALAVAGVIILGCSGAALGQVTFQPTGCEFRVWFVAEPITQRQQWLMWTAR